MLLSPRSALLILSLAGLAALSGGPASAGDCTGPGSSYQQIGEVYRGDEVSVYDRRGNWYAITCMSGRCTRPMWGTPMPSGWVSRKYVDARGVCP